MNKKIKILLALSSLFVLINSSCAKNEVIQEPVNLDFSQSLKTEEENKFGFITPGAMTLREGQMYKFNARIQLKDGTYSKSINWTSSNPFVARMAFDGWVTGDNDGYATITATAREDFTRRAYANINVIK
jgi:hypothetical protein